MNIRLILNRAQRDKLAELLKANEMTLGDPPGWVTLCFEALVGYVHDASGEGQDQ